MNRFITDTLKQRTIFADGKNFNYLISGLLQKKILQNEKDAPKIFKEAKLYSTDNKMYNVPLSVEVRAEDSPQKLHFSKVQTPKTIKLTASEGGVHNLSSDKMKQGMKNFIIEAGKSVKIELSPQA